MVSESLKRGRSGGACSDSSSSAECDLSWLRSLGGVFGFEAGLGMLVRVRGTATGGRGVIDPSSLIVDIELRDDSLAE